MSLAENINLPPTLLSRFDLVYLVLDQRDNEKDRKLAKHLISLFWRDVPANTMPVGVCRREGAGKQNRRHRTQLQRRGGASTTFDKFVSTCPFASEGSCRIHVVRSCAWMAH